MILNEKHPVNTLTMNVLVSVLLCVFSTSVASGQDEWKQSDVDAKNYLNYYQAVANAEEDIVNGNYRDAIKRYQVLFEEYPYNNPIDCYIAAQVSSYMGDTVTCLDFINKGVNFGLPVQTINSNPHLAGHLKKVDKHTIESCRGAYEKRIDARARATMLSLIKRDQSVIHNLLPGESIYGPDGYTLKDIYRPLWDSLVREVIMLTQSSGFPAQKIIGTQNGEDSLFQAGPNSVFAVYIFIHHGRAWKQVGAMLWQELLKGNITPQMYGVIYESSNGKSAYNDSVHYFASRPCQESLCKKAVKRNIDAINKARWDIGLGSYEVMQKKFKSRALYYKWCKERTGKNEPFFDFQCDLSFQGKQTHS